MELPEKIVRAFSSRLKPAQTIDDGILQMDSDVEEALWFSGRDWHELTWQNWQEHSDAIFFFNPEAFAYYLPSLLTLSAQNSSDSLMAADSVISYLDQSPDPEGWTDGLVHRFLGLKPAELSVLKEWLLQICEYQAYRGVGISASGPGEKLGRAFDTIDLLQQQIERRRLASS